MSYLDNAGRAAAAAEAIELLSRRAGHLMAHDRLDDAAATLRTVMAALLDLIDIDPEDASSWAADIPSMLTRAAAHVQHLMPEGLETPCHVCARERLDPAALHIGRWSPEQLEVLTDPR